MKKTKNKSGASLFSKELTIFFLQLRTKKVTKIQTPKKNMWDMMTIGRSVFIYPAYMSI